VSEHDLPELPPDVSALLAEARGVPAAPPIERRKVAARLAISVGLAIPGTTLAVSRAASSTLGAKALGVALFVVAAAGLTRVATRTPAAHAPAPITRSAPTHTPTVAPTPMVVRAPMPVVEAPVAPPPLARHSLAPAVTAPPAVDEDQSFRDELSLLERAHGRLASDDVDGATATLAQHARRFPHGRLEPEREALRVQCAAARGDRDAAEAARRRFHQRFPDSVLGASVDRAVDGVQ
jgi:hypothetical protein